jgi:hypothetical protein
MNRLTEKVKDIEAYIKLPTKDKQAFLNKLGEHEDIAEDLGIELPTLIKAGECFYAYSKDNDEPQGTIGKYVDCLINIKHKCLFVQATKDIYFFKEYGIWWALTRKELRKDRSE